MLNTIQELSFAINEVVKAYTSDSQSEAFFVESISQLKNLNKRLRSNNVRIAIIGITSSGKSTLLNTILGSDLLPTRVAPSSSKQVICGYDKEQYALVKFIDGSGKQELRVKKDIKKELSKYGDEKHNPGNREQVEELQVFSPRFNFRKELIFVDTPGLDAYGLSEHEEITLKLVLPSVDMVLFLTNVKCDSDKKNLEFIDRATSKEKPLIVVQNKIDSIAEKRDKKHGVLKTKEVVKKEHFNRIQKLLAEAKNKSVRNAPIVQISAKCPKWENSNLETLKEALSLLVDKNLERFKWGHIRQFQKQLQEDHDTLSRLLKDHTRQEEELNATLRVLDGHYQNLEKAKKLQKDIDKNIHNKLDAIINEAESLIESLSGKTKKKFSLDAIINEAESLIESLSGKTKKKFSNSKEEIVSHLTSCLRARADRDSSNKDEQLDSLPSQINQKFESFKTNIQEITPYFSRSITEMQNALKVCCDDMNLNYRQILKITPVGAFQMDSEDITETIQGKYHEPERIKVKKSGFWNKLKRVWGWLTNDDDLGYERIIVREGYYEEKTVYSVKKMVAYIQANSKKLFLFFEDKYPKFDSDTAYSIDKLQERYDSLLTQLEVQRTGKLSKQLITNLKATIDKWLLPDRELKQGFSIEQRPEAKAHNKSNYPTVKQELLEENCRPWEAALLLLAQSQCMTINRKYMLGLIKKSNLRRVCVCGWDKNHMENFLNFFFSDQSQVECIDFTSIQPLQASAFSYKLVFLLVNVEQSGSTENKIYSPDVVELLANAARTGKIVWVMDTVNGLANWKEPNQDTLAEAYFEMVRMAEEFMTRYKQKPYDFMACDSELYYSVLFREMYFSNLNSQSKRQNFIAEISKIFHLNTERQHITGRYLNDFKNRINKGANDI